MQIARGRDDIRSASYGLSAVCDFALFVSPRTFGDWLRTEASHWAASAVVNHMLRNARLGLEARARLSIHLDTNVPVLQAMGMEAHMEQLSSVDEAFDGLAHAARQLRRRSTSNAQAFALATIVFDRVRLLRLWELDAVVSETPSALPGPSFVQLPPKQAHHPTSADRRRLMEMALKGAQDGAFGARAAAADRLLDAGFDLLAEHAPSAALTDLQIAQLTRCFVGDPSQYFVRLAQRVQSVPLKESILKLAVREFQNLLLPTVAADPFEHQPSSSEDMEERLRWFGEATRMITVPKDRTLDRHVGLLLHPLTEAANKVFDQPYAADVRPNAYASALQRRLQGVWMALHLGHGWPDGPAPLPNLMKVALKQADLVLQKCRGDIDDQGWQYRVVGTALALMEPGSPGDRREAWLHDDRMPPLVRCMSLWSSAPMIEGRASVALDLLHQALLDLNAGDAWSVASLSLELLDSSIGQARRLDDTALEDGIVRVWESSLIRWSPLWRERLRPIAATLLRAVRGGALERDQLLGSPDFGGSRCAQLCREEALSSRPHMAG
ncbi:hypothetical protein ASF45_32095 [Pseudorhodoferax sp. Leaf265]|nr:hypothetical protein ASF45_32095 [Pseudorhodoferax sp. Leaf265]